MSMKPTQTFKRTKNWDKRDLSVEFEKKWAIRERKKKEESENSSDVNSSKKFTDKTSDFHPIRMENEHICFSSAKPWKPAIA